MAKRRTKRAEARGRRRAAKEAGMKRPGGASAYALKHEWLNRGLRCPASEAVEGRSLMDVLLESTAAPRVHCSASSHAHAKATPSIWRTWLPCGEPMVIEADEFGPGYSLELKTCPSCFSTCAVEVQS